MLARDDGLKVREDSSDVTIVADLGNLAILDITDTNKGIKGLLGLLSGPRISQVVEVLLKTRHHLGQERSHDLRVIDELAHVVDNHSGLSLDSGVSLSKTTIQQRNHESQSRLLNFSNESGGTEQVDSLGNILGLRDTLDELRNEALDITVHRLVGMLLDFLLSVPHRLGDDRDQLGNTEGKLSRSVLDKDIDAVESSNLLGPLLGSQDGVDDVGQDGLDSVGADGLGDGERSSDGSILDASDLVANGGKNEGKKDDEVRLNVGRDLGMLGNVLDSNGGLLTGERILLVRDLLLQRLDSPRRITC